MNAASNVTVVSNRLPFVVRHAGDDRWEVNAGSGGLVSALVPVLRQRGGRWIGWDGHEDAPSRARDAALADASAGCGYTVAPVQLTQAEVRDFYQGFSNEVIWPLFHDLPSVCNFDPAYWRAYTAANRKYAAAVAVAAPDEGFVWVHDYHLMNVGAELRAMGSRAPLGFFLHIPFPSLDIFEKLPWCARLIDALLQYDLIGFQTLRDRRNFVQCVRALSPLTPVETRGRSVVAVRGERSVRIGAFPVSVDMQSLARQAALPDVERKVAELRQQIPVRTRLLAINRLDYTKGIPQRLQAFHDLLTRRADLRGHVSLIEVVVPSRADIAEYDGLKGRIEQMVGRINGEFMKPGGWIPIWYHYGHLEPTELSAYYRVADVALVTPLRDGMNLVAKEYCASNVDENGVLVLSAFAGAAAQLGDDALLVNPYDIEGVGNAIESACAMDDSERRSRMRRMRQGIHRHDVFGWVDAFLSAALADRADARIEVAIDAGSRRSVHAGAARLPAAAANDALARATPASLLN
jgi:trehalose 6-phosphate synthase